MHTSPVTRIHRLVDIIRRLSVAAAVAAFASVAILPTSAGATTTPVPTSAESVTREGPTHTPTSAEGQVQATTPASEVVREATPTQAPQRSDRARRRSGPPTERRQHRADGPELRIAPTTATNATAAAGTSVAVSSGSVSGLWAGGFSSNPNRQVGKLYYDVQVGPGENWKWCTATVVTARNLSTVVTAGHCVFTPDPDNNGLVERNGFWHENIRFCPGYEYGCRLGQWTYRRASTTSSWAYGLSGRYNFADDVAVVLLNRDTGGRYVQNVTGAQGILFNQATGLQRHAFGYPGYDARWPQYGYNAEDLVYAAGRDTNDTTYPGTMWMSSTMTGGSSGGPWIISPNSSWYGYVNSVNSHKPWGGPYMNGSYFGAAEAKLYSDWQAA